MRKFCFICGKKTDKLADGRCDDCMKGRAFVELPDRIEVTQCNKCKKMFFNNRWADFSLEKIVENSGKARGKVEKVRAALDGKKVAATFILTPDSADNVVEEMHEASFHTNKIICPTCSRKHSGYYEAVLQLRGFGEDDLEKMREIFDALERKTFYRINEVKGGFDVKVGNKLVVNTAAKDIRKKFPSEIKKSFSIVTKIDGRDVHRKFVLIRKLEKQSS